MLLEFRPILLGALLCLPSIHAEHRIALLIGNSTYEVRPLKNPANDVTALGQRLAKLGFESNVVVNANTDTMETAAKAFAARLQPGDVALFYYAPSPGRPPACARAANRT